MDPGTITIIVTTTANLLLQLFTHIKSSSCWGINLVTTGETTTPIVNPTPTSTTTSSTK
jgi:hypothetical protein